MRVGQDVLPGGSFDRIGNEKGMVGPLYHGSPHDFDKFDVSKIGTGEGAQAYGHGLYFAENKAVAEAYRPPSITWKAVRDKYAIGNQKAGETLAIAGGKADEAVSSLKRQVEYLERTAKNHSGEWGPQAAEEHAANMLKTQDAIKQIESGNVVAAPGTGKMYKANINADPEDFLDWDKPLSQQSAKVRKAIGQLVERNIDKESGWQKLTGEQALGAIVERSGAKGKAEAMLHKAGIKGIRYLDQGSRNAGGWKITPPTETRSGKWMVKSSDYNSKGLHFATEAEARAALAEKVAGQTSNYVTFGDEGIDILEKGATPLKMLGLTGVASGGALTAALLHQSKRKP